MPPPTRRPRTPGTKAASTRCGRRWRSAGASSRRTSPAGVSQAPSHLQPRSRGRLVAEGDTAVQFGGLIPADRGVLRGGQHVTVESLERIRLQERMTTAALDQAADRPDAELDHKRLISPVTSTVEQ